MFWVCPLIDESKKIDHESAVKKYKFLNNIFPNLVGLIHGSLNRDEKEKTLKMFLNKKYKILVSTTVIEVGIDFPNANIIIIENSNKFGLSQLHQLRGRVGRGNKESFCYLVYKDGQKQESFGRLEAIEKSTNGFEIAEEDLKLRGSGDYLGLKQSGEYKNFKLASSEDAIENFDFLKESIIKECLINDDKGKDLIERWDMDIESGINL